MFYQYNKSHFDGFFQTRPFLPEVFVYSYMFLPLLYGFENYRNFCLLFIISYIFIKIKIKSRNSQEAQAPWLFKKYRFIVLYFYISPNFILAACVISSAASSIL